MTDDWKGKSFSCSHWNRGILSSFGMNLLLRIPRYVTKLEGGHWLVGPSFKLLMQSMTAVMTPDHLTLHFPSGSGIPAVTLRCQVMSSVEWQWNFSRTCVPQWGVMVCFWLYNCKTVGEASYLFHSTTVYYGSSSIKQHPCVSNWDVFVSYTPKQAHKVAIHWKQSH